MAGNCRYFSAHLKQKMCIGHYINHIDCQNPEEPAVHLSDLHSAYRAEGGCQTEKNPAVRETHTASNMTCKMEWIVGDITLHSESHFSIQIPKAVPKAKLNS